MDLYGELSQTSTTPSTGPMDQRTMHPRSKSFDATLLEKLPAPSSLRGSMSTDSFHLIYFRGSGLDADDMLRNGPTDDIKGGERRPQMHEQLMFMPSCCHSAQYVTDCNSEVSLVTTSSPFVCQSAEMPRCKMPHIIRKKGCKTPKCRVTNMFERSTKVAPILSDLGSHCAYTPDDHDGDLQKGFPRPKYYTSQPITSAPPVVNYGSHAHRAMRHSSRSGPLSGPHIPPNNYHSCCVKKQMAGKPDRYHISKAAGQPLLIQGFSHASEVDARTYFAALEGPEFDVLKNSDESLAPSDEKWPFLLRFPINCFGICLGLGSQSILWKTLSTAISVQFLHIPKSINFTLWCLALMALLSVFTTYMLKCIFYFEAVRREFYHPVRINFFFAPWIAAMFLVLGVPPSITRSINPMLWVCFMAPIFILELKIYGQWLSGGERRLSRVANPSTHLSLVGNFVGALLAATIGWKEFAIFFWAVGVVHYLVLFVTLYQRLPTATVLPKQLHPVFFLFVAAPSNASIAWTKIVGDFDFVSRIAYFVGLFLYTSLVVRVNFFRGFRFSVTWWAYTFPMTASAIATIHYSVKVRHPITQGMAVLLCLVSSVTVFLLLCFTAAHIFFGYSFFPNDMAIAITSAADGVSKCRRSKRKIRDVISMTSPTPSTGDDSSSADNLTSSVEMARTIVV